MPGTARISLLVGAAAASMAWFSAAADPLPPSATYRPLPTLPLSAVKANDEAEKPQVMRDQQSVLDQRYDLSNNPIPGVMMSGGRKPVQGGVRVKLPAGATWDTLAGMSPDEVRQRGLLPPGFTPLPHVKQATGGQVIPNNQIDEIRTQEGPQPAPFRCRFRSPRHLHAGVPAADLFERAS